MAFNINNAPVDGHSPCDYCTTQSQTQFQTQSLAQHSTSLSSSSPISFSTNSSPRTRSQRTRMFSFQATATFLLYLSTRADASTRANTNFCTSQGSMARRHDRTQHLRMAFTSSRYDPEFQDHCSGRHHHAPHKSLESSFPHSSSSSLYAVSVDKDVDTDESATRNNMNSHETEAKIKLREKQLKIARLKSSINYQAIPYRTSSTNMNTNTNMNMNGMRNILKEVPTPIKERVASLTTEPKHQLTTAINKALKLDVKKKNGKRRNGYSKNGKSRSRDGRYNGDKIEALAPPPPSKKITIRNLWKKRHAHSIDEGIRRERALEFETTGQQLSEILDGSTEEGKPKKKPRRYAARTIAGLISALTEEATGLEVAVDARNDTPLWKKQVDSLEINFSRLGVRALRMGGLDEALMDMSEDLSPDEKESMADSLQEEAKHAYDNFDLVGAPAANSTIDEIFDRIDTDNSGTLDEEELTRALGMASGLSSPSIKAQSSSALSKLVSRLINLYDTNGDGVVDREEYRKLVEDMAEVRKMQKQKQKERQEKKQEERERPGTFHPLKLLQTANRTFQRLSKKNKEEESDTRVSNTGYDRLSSHRHSQASEPMTTAAEGNGVNFEGAQDISDDPSFMNTISKGEGSILFSDLKLDLRRLLFGAVPIVKRITPGGPLILEPFTMSVKVSFTKEDVLGSIWLDDGLRRLVARALRRRVRSVRDLVDGAVFYGRTWNMASREAPVVEVPKIINIEFDKKNRMIITGRAKVRTSPDQPFVENSFKLRTKLGTRENGQFIRLEEPELALVIECPKAWERNIVSVCKNFDLPIPERPEPLYSFFPLVSPIKKTDQDGFNLGEDNRIHSIYVKDNALRLEMSSVLRPGRFLGNHYLAFTLPNRTFIITMDRIREGIRQARQNKREMEQYKKDLELSKKREASIRYNRAVAQALASSSSNGGSNAENVDLSYNIELDEDLSFTDPSTDIYDSDIVPNNRPGFFGRFLEGYLEAAREETERERNERLTTAISEFFSPDLDTSDER